MSAENILKIAASQIGEKEIVGAEDNPQIVAYAQETGISGINDDDIPWCSTFVNWCAMKASLPYSGKANARSWVHIGIATSNPIPGDIVVFWRERVDSWKGHVGIFIGFNNDGAKVFCLGGNQNNEVNITAYDANKVIGFRRLSKNESVSIPSPVLKKGDRGLEVTKLQKLVNLLGYNCGDADGHFGEKTASALRNLQANNRLEMDGVYGSITKDCLVSLMQS